MNITILAFGGWAVVLAVLGFAMTRQAVATTMRAGGGNDSTLGPQSVNWLGALGFGGALLFCILL